MERRTLLAFLLSMLVFGGYYWIHQVYFPPPPSERTAPETRRAESAPRPESKAAESQTAPKVLPQELIPEKISVTHTPLYQVEMSNQGGVGKSFLIKAYRETTGKNSPSVDLFADSSHHNLLLIMGQSNFSLPPFLPFQVVQEGNNFVEYQWRSPELVLTKRVDWNSDNYVGTVTFTLENLSGKNLETSVGLRLEAAQHPKKEQKLGFLSQGQQNFITPIFYKENNVERLQDLSKLSTQTELTGNYQWVGLEDRYFLWALVSRLSSDLRVQYGLEGNRLYSHLIYPKEIIAAQSKLTKEFTVYVGPKEMDRLKLLNVGLEKAVDYGWFSVVAHPILFLLKFFHRGMKNWGIAIILLTVFIKILLHPINKKSMDSMKAMQKIQPKLNEVREKYKNDRERLNVEMMNLFKANKVNPVGGCLPMLLQMPVYIALYKVLYNAIELYHAPFFGFYKDLSAPDPYFILPIILGIFMVVQQKMTPTAQDPAQAKAMLIMPIVFSAFMLFLPSGLVLYIFVNTLVTVVQQYMNKHDLGFKDLLGRIRQKG